MFFIVVWTRLLNLLVLWGARNKILVSRLTFPDSVQVFLHQTLSDVWESMHEAALTVYEAKPSFFMTSELVFYLTWQNLMMGKKESSYFLNFTKFFEIQKKCCQISPYRTHDVYSLPKFVAVRFSSGCERNNNFCNLDDSLRSCDESLSKTSTRYSDLWKPS